MKTAAGRLVLALVLFVGGAACWAEARLTRLAAEAHQRFATLHYDGENTLEEAAAAGVLQWPFGGLRSDIRRYQREVSYWRARHDALLGLPAPPDAPDAPGLSGNAANSELMLLTANSAFRSSQREQNDRAVAVERLDNVMQAYAEVLRADPGSLDASYNYEYVARFRDTLATGKGPLRPRDQKPDQDVVRASVDLPPGPTIHGRPGGPPLDLPGADFKTIAPMPYEEREESDPGGGPAPRRRG